MDDVKSSADLDLETALEEEKQQRRSQLMRRKVPEAQTLLAALLAMTKQVLDDIRYNLCVKGASSLKKAELAEKLVSEIIRFSRRWFVSMLEEQYEMFSYLCQHDGISTEFKQDDARLDYLRGIGLLACGAKEDKLAWYMPQEVRAEFKKLDSAALKKAAAANSEMLRLSAGMVFYYGVLDYDQLFARVNTLIDASDRTEFFDFLGVMLNGGCWYNHIVATEHGLHYYTVLHAEALEDEQRQHGQLDYAPFAYDRLYEAGEENYIEATAEYKQLAQFFMKQHKRDVLQAADIVGEITIILQNGSGMQEVVEYLESQELLKDEALAEAVTPLLIAYNNTLPLWTHKGHTPAELMDPEQAREAQAPLVQHEPHQPKVGRNDPCPCGSGKKYKRCCYNKDRLGQ